MRKKPVIVTLVALGALGVGIAIVATSSPRITQPSVSFVGYTNDASGGRRGLFAITNRATQTLNMLLSPQHSVDGRVAGLERLSPGATITASVPAPNTSLSWRAVFTFLPARVPLGYRLKMWVHRAGLRPDMTLPTVEVSSDLIQ